MKNIYLDIETIPAQPEETLKAVIAQTISAPNTMKKAETISDWHNGNGKYVGEKEKQIEKVYRDTSFDASLGQICSIAWGDDKETFSIGDHQSAEGKMLNHFFNHVVEMCAEKMHTSEPKFIGHWVAGFDLKFLWRRAVILGVKPPFPLRFNGYHDKDYYCTQSAWCGYRDTVSMEKLAEAFGIKCKEGMNGSMVWDEYKAGNFQGIADYNISDVDTVREIHKRLTFGEK